MQGVCRREATCHNLHLSRHAQAAMQRPRHSAEFRASVATLSGQAMRPRQPKTAWTYSKSRSKDAGVICAKCRSMFDPPDDFDKLIREDRIVAMRDGCHTRKSPDAMDIRSVRLPPSLWRRLEVALAEVNRARARRVSMSSVMRALLERGLEDPGPALDFGARVYRPERAAQARAALQAETYAQRSASLLRDRVNAAVDRLQVDAGGIRGCCRRRPAQCGKIDHSALLPDHNAAELVDRVSEWLARVEIGASSSAGYQSSNAS